MRAEVRPLNVLGKPLPKAQHQKEPACRGKLHVAENRMHAFGRVVNCATLTSATDGLDTPLLPELLDVQIIWLDNSSMRLRGIEDVGGTLFAQTWDIKVL